MSGRVRANKLQISIVKKKKKKTSDTHLILGVKSFNNSKLDTLLKQEIYIEILLVMRQSCGPRHPFV